MKKKALIKILFSVTALLFVFSLASCSLGEPEPNNSVFYGSFDTTCVVWDYTGMDGEDFSALASDIEASAAHYHRLFDAYREYEGVINIASLNRLAGTGPVKVDSAIIDLISFSKEMYSLTDGKVNFALGSVTYLWKTLTASYDSEDNPQEPRVPTEAELSEAGKHISPDSVLIDKENSTVEITDPDTRIDVGAIAKGYAAELIKKELAALGYGGIILDFGGNICAVGIEREVPIRNPLYFEGADEPYIRRALVSSEALVTSGGYQRYQIIDGERYHHIIDPESLRPESRYLSVTVKTSDSGVADALSTALFNTDYEEVKEFVSAFDEKIEITLVFLDGKSEIIEN